MMTATNVIATKSATTEKERTKRATALKFLGFAFKVAGVMVIGYSVAVGIIRFL